MKKELIEEAVVVKNKVDKSQATQEQTTPVATLEEKRLIELREDINNDKFLDEYVYLYMTMLLSHASRLKVNFEEIKKLVNKE